MWQYLLFAGGYAFAAAIQPGPLQAFFVSRVAAHGWQRTLPACLSPLLSDGPIALLALLVLGQLSSTAQAVLQGAGGLLLVYLAWGALQQWRHSSGQDEAPSTPRTVLEATLVNLLNPNVYISWTLVLGPMIQTAWAEQRAYAVALLAAFYATLVGTMAAFIYLVGTARFLGSRFQRGLVGISAVVLAALGVYLLVRSCCV